MWETKKQLRSKLSQIENTIRIEEARKTPTIFIVEKIKQILVKENTGDGRMDKNT